MGSHLPKSACKFLICFNKKINKSLNGKFYGCLPLRKDNDSFIDNSLSRLAIKCICPVALSNHLGSTENTKYLYYAVFTGLYTRAIMVAGASLPRRKNEQIFLVNF